MKTDYRIGDRVILDGATPAVVTNTSVFVGRAGGFSSVRTVGVSVRPLAGGRARVVSFHRVTPDGGAR